MDYQAIYDRLIAKYKDHPKIKSYTNSHHIIPKSFAKIDGIDDIDGSWNRVNLPLREHFVAHLLLARIWRHHKVKGPMMAFAFGMMSECRKLSSKNYSWIKSTLDYSHSNETKQKIAGSLKGKTKSVEAKMKMSEKAKNRSNEHKEKIAASNTGKTRSTEAKEKMSAWQKGKSKEKLACPICRKIVSGKTWLSRHIKSHEK